MERFSLKKSRLWFFLLFFIIGFLFFLLSKNIPISKIQNYYTLLFGYFIVSTLFCLTITQKRTHFFDPIVIITILYLAMFSIYPMYDNLRSEFMKEGVDTSAGTVKGTVIFVLAYWAFWIFYNFTSDEVRKRNGNMFQKIDAIPNSTLVLSSYFWWAISYVACVFAQLSRGFSLSYLFSFGTAGTRVLAQDSSVMFLLNFGPTLILALCMICVYGRNRLLKASCVGLTVLYLFMRNGRWLIMIIGLAPIVYWYMKRKREPNGGLIALISFGGMGILSLMQLVRNSIAVGESFSQIVRENLFSIDTYLAPFESDFTTYRTYYGIVLNIPSHFHYLLGQGMILNTLQTIVPRALWANKPLLTAKTVVLEALNSTAVANGEAYPNIGEYYSEFGIIGCIVLMSIFGYLAAKSKKLYKLDSRSALIVYSVLWPFYFQVTSRIFSSNVYYVLFALLPLLSALALSKIQFRVVDRHG